MIAYGLDHENTHEGQIDENCSEDARGVLVKKQRRRNVRHENIHEHRGRRSKQQICPDALLTLLNAQIRDCKSGESEQQQPEENRAGAWMQRKLAIVSRYPLRLKESFFSCAERRQPGKAAAFCETI